MASSPILPPAALPDSTQSPISPPLLTADTPLRLRLDGVSPLILALDAAALSTVTITVQALGENPLDTTLEILKPGGTGGDASPAQHRLAYNDDCGEVLAAEWGLAPTDSALVSLVLPQEGRYWVVVNSFNGVSQGEVEIRLSRVPPIPAEVVRAGDSTTIFTITLPLNAVYRYVFDAAASDLVTITAFDPSGLLDSVLTMRDDSGAVIAHNDDHASESLTLNIFDARLAVTLPKTGEYTLELREFMGRSGVIIMTVYQ